jgi:hypothetical protein
VTTRNLESGVPKIVNIGASVIEVG